MQLSCVDVYRCISGKNSNIGVDVMFVVTVDAGNEKKSLHSYDHFQEHEIC